MGSFTSNNVGAHSMPHVIDNTPNRVVPQGQPRTNLISNTDPEGKHVNLQKIPEKVLHNIAVKDYGPIMDKILKK